MLFRSSKYFDISMQNWVNKALFKPTKGVAPQGRPLGKKEHSAKEYPAPKRFRTGTNFYGYAKKEKTSD